MSLRDYYLRLEPNEDVLISTLAGVDDAALITRADLEDPGPTIIAVTQPLCAMTGYDEAELIGKNPRIFQGPLTDRAVLNDLHEKCARGEPFVGEAVNYRKDGTTFLIEWAISPMRDADERVTHFISIQRDVTRARRFARAWLDADAAARAASAQRAVQAEAIHEAIRRLEQVDRVVRSRALADLRSLLAKAVGASGSPK